MNSTKDKTMSETIAGSDECNTKRPEEQEDKAVVLSTTNIQGSSHPFARSLFVQANDLQQEEMADAFSSSLASIAVEGRELAEKASNTANEKTTTLNWQEENGVESSSGSSTTTLKPGEEGGAVVTSTATTTSSGDDRDSGEGNSSRSPSAPNSDSSKGNTASSGRLEPKGHHQTHSYTMQHRSRKRPSVVKSSDDYGLPVPRNDRWQAENAMHTTVVAHLPPPNADATSSSGSSGEGEERANTAAATVSLLQPKREPGFHTIRHTFKRFATREKAMSAEILKNSETDSSGEQVLSSSNRKFKRPSGAATLDWSATQSKPPPLAEPPPTESASGGNDDAGGSSGSGTEGGYVGSASSNENAAQGGSCSSPSVSSSDDYVSNRKHSKGKNASSGDATRPLVSKKQLTHSESSEIADFSSGVSESDTLPSESPSISSSSGGDGSSDDQEDRFESRKKSRKAAKKREKPVAAKKREKPVSSSRTAPAWPLPPLALQVSSRKGSAKEGSRRARIGSQKPIGLPKCDTDFSVPMLEGKPPLLTVGCDIMAHILTFLEPPSVVDVLTMPLSKDWLGSFTRQPELWRVLCLLEPFKANVEEDDDSSDASVASFPFAVQPEMKNAFGKFRLMYTSFVRCMRYLARIKDDAVNGRPPTSIDFAAPSELPSHNIGANQNLQQFLARARGVVVRDAARVEENASSNNPSDISDTEKGDPVARQVAQASHVGISDDGSSTTAPRKRRKREKGGQRKKPKFAHSKLTQRLLGPSASGHAGEVELPWSCAIYSIVNWMVSFADVEGIQRMCLTVLPFLLENEQQRITAQRAGLTEIVLRGMVKFSESAILHTAAFHTIVLLARPLGGREGMLFHTSMVNASVIFGASKDARDEKNGIGIMLDSMRRFQDDEVLQAMSCWSLVNIALEPGQKEALVRLGGIEATTNAMMAHPYNAEVQFRALFALINLVIPSVNVESGQPQVPVRSEGNEVGEVELLGKYVDRIVNLVVSSMKNFCASEAILNRACLVLHNLSLTQEHHSALLWTPNCFQMLEWAMVNYKSDMVLQQSAAGTLHRLQTTMSNDEGLRARFTASLQAQQQASLEQAHREAVLLHQQMQQQQQQNNEIATGEDDHRLQAAAGE